MLGERRMVEYPANSRHICRSLFCDKNLKRLENPLALFSPNFAKATMKEVQNVVRTAAFLASVRTIIVTGTLVILLCLSR